MASNVTVDLRPQVINLNLYGTDPWAVAFAITGLGTLADATVEAKFRPKGEDESVDLDVAVTGEAEGEFTVGSDTPADGRYDIAITLSGGLPRTYIWGTIRVQADVA